MIDEEKTREQLINELVELRQQVFELRVSAANNRQNGNMQHVLAEVIENMPDGIIVTDTNGQMIYVNSALEKLHGFSRNELIGKFPTILVSDENADSIFPNAINCMQLSDKWCREVLLKRKDGSTLVEAECFPVIDNNGEPIAWAAINRDISKRKQAEKALRLSEDRFSKIFNASPFTMVICTITDGRFLYVNDIFVKNTGYQREEVIGRTALELNIWVNPEERAKMIQMLSEQGFIRDLEVCFYNKYGELHIVLLSAEIISFNDEQYMLSVSNNITERKQFKKEMALLDRLHLVGEIAAGIGHEIRNPMTTIRGLLQLLREKKEITKHKGYFDLMIEELDRANTIITEFLSLARNKVVKYEMKNINTIIETLFPLMQADAMKSDKFIYTELSQIPDLLLNEKEIRQLILNLVRNGLEAMSPKGILIVRTFTDGDGVVLAVQDQGKGIEPEILEKIGRPFFTTKENGTGLGLAVCYSIVASHNAKIDIETSSSGTTFFARFKI